jgi:cytoskeletal protein RodZ
MPRVTQAYVEETPAPRRRWILWTVLTVFVGLVVTLGVASLAAYQFRHQPTPAAATHNNPSPTADVKLTACEPVPQYHSGAFTLTVTNHTSATVSYVIAVAFQSSNGQIRYDLMPVTVAYLGAGQTTTVTNKDIVYLPDGFTCKTVAIHRQPVMPWTSASN